jgi:NAD(P)-dependent dehydrogenase (short-subunit alcohol dehydrogenase family)
MRKTALVIGGSRGIGRACCVALAQADYDIAFTYHTDEAAAAETKAAVEAQHSRCFYYPAHMQNSDAPAQAVSAAIADLTRLDACVTVAGITRFLSLTELTAERADEIYSCNFRAPLLCASLVAKHMIAKKIQGGIIHIASTHAFAAYPKDQVYGGLKAAIVRATESEALELSRYGIRVNCVAPGMISIRGADTPEHLRREWAPKVPLGRWGTAGDVANAVTFLLSEKSSYITGVTLKVDGGLVLPGMPEDASPAAGYGWSDFGLR